MDMYYRKAKPISFSKSERDRGAIKYIVIHYTQNENDTAKNNVDYFANWNTEEAGAHFFVDQNGKIGRSIPMNRTAWSVGGNKYKTGGACYGKVTNENSISIELCSLTKGEPSDAMVSGVKSVIKYIQTYCPNATTIVRHYDVTGKPCPVTMVDADAWSKFLNRIGYAIVGEKL